MQPQAILGRKTVIKCVICLDFRLLRPLYEYGACSGWLFREVHGADQQQQVSRTRLQTAVWSSRRLHVSTVALGLLTRSVGLATRPAA
jgi:hypothetical protein